MNYYLLVILFVQSVPPQSFLTPTFLLPEEPGSNKSLPSILEEEPIVSPGTEKFWIPILNFPWKAIMTHTL